MPIKANKNLRTFKVPNGMVRFSGTSDAARPIRPIVRAKALDNLIYQQLESCGEKKYYHRNLNEEEKKLFKLFRSNFTNEITISRVGMDRIDTNMATRSVDGWAE